MTKNKNYKILKWDTNFFGFGVAKITVNKIDEQEMHQILEKLKNKNIKLVYWFFDAKIKKLDKIAKSCNGFLADKKTTFIINFNKILLEDSNLNNEIISYKKSVPNRELKKLAVQAGLFSRYSVDPKIKKYQFEKLYTIWIAKSTDKKIADAVLVAKNKNKILGMITLGKKNNRGDIGLIAVDSNARGQGLGTKLIKASQSWFINNGYKTGQVVTQKDNVPACKLYKKCGYKIEKIENIYHFWL